MAVSFDNAASTSGTAVSTLTTPAFTVTSSANVVGVLGLSLSGTTSTGFSGDIGGTAGAAIAGTDSGAAQTIRSLMFGMVAPPSGSQTGTMSWTTAFNAVLGAETVFAADQTAPFQNGTFKTGTSSPAITTLSTMIGDLTMDTIAASEAGGGSLTVAGTGQTSRWNVTFSATFQGAGGSMASADGIKISPSWTIGGVSPKFAQSVVDISPSGGGIPTMTAPRTLQFKGDMIGRRWL